MIGYIEEDDEEDEEEDEKTKGEGRLESNPPPTMDKNRFRIAAKAVLLPASRMPLAAGDNMVGLSVAGNRDGVVFPVLYNCVCLLGPAQELRMRPWPMITCENGR